MDINFWVGLIKQYGPVVGLLVAFIIWQTVQINKLLDRNSKIYEGEIQRLAQVQDRLLTRLLGPQPSSLSAPAVKLLDSEQDATKKSDGAQGERP